MSIGTYRKAVILEEIYEIQYYHTMKIRECQVLARSSESTLVRLDVVKNACILSWVIYNKERKDGYTMLKCAECGKPIQNAYYINGVAYGYNCYKQKLALICKQCEDEHNKEYSIKCFAAMQIFQDKKSNNFHDSICKQWNECKKITAKQLECIIKGFTSQEKIYFWIVWHSLTNDENLKSDLASWLENEIQDFSEYVENEAVINCLLSGVRYKKRGFHFLRDVDDSETVYIMENGKNNKRLNENLEDEEIEVIKIVEGCQ